MALNQMSHFISPLKMFVTDPAQRPEKSTRFHLLAKCRRSERANERMQVGGKSNQERLTCWESVSVDRSFLSPSSADDNTL